MEQSDADIRVTGLRRAIRLRHATAMVAGTIIGASIFVQPSEITGRVPSVGGAVAVWLVAGLLTLFGALVCAEWARQLPESGGVYAFLRRAFSPALGFLWGWAMFWTMHSGIIAAIAVVFARYAGFFVPLGSAGTDAVAVGAILLLSAVNYLGVRQGSALQTAFTYGKVAAILLMIVVGFALGPRATADLAVGEGGGPTTAVAADAEPVVREAEVADGEGAGAGVADFLLALVAGLFAFGGWHMVTYSAEETDDPRRTIPVALVAGVAVVTLCYVGLNAVYFHVLPLDRVIASDRVAAEAADAVLGFGGGAAMSALVVFSTFGALAGIVLAGPRVYYAMARDGLLFGWAGAIHPVHRTPHRAILLQAAWASVLVLTGTYRALFTRVIYTEWIFFGLLALGLLRLGRVPEAAGATPRTEGDRVGRGIAAIAIVFAVAAFAVVANQVVADPGEAALGLGFVLVGWPVYHLWARPRSTGSGEAS